MTLAEQFAQLRAVAFAPNLTAMEFVKWTESDPIANARDRELMRVAREERIYRERNGIPARERTIATTLAILRGDEPMPTAP